VLSHYKKLQVVYIDQDENVIFLWVANSICCIHINLLSPTFIYRLIY
jgi:hypothetical protein